MNGEPEQSTNCECNIMTYNSQHAQRLDVAIILLAYLHNESARFTFAQLHLELYVVQLGVGNSSSTCDEAKKFNIHT